MKSKVGLYFGSARLHVLEHAVLTRMALHGLRSPQTYHALMAGPLAPAGEWQALLALLLNHETAFLRDAGLFGALQSTVVPALFADRPIQVPLNAWSAGCATGEEAYSLGMIIAEVADHRQFTVWGTDISERAIGTARHGLYPSHTIDQIPPALRAKYVMANGAWASTRSITSELRARIRFTCANLLSEGGAPLYHDLILCCNVLIYFDQPERRRILDALVRRLAPQGVLIVGPGDAFDEHPTSVTPLPLGAWRAWRRVAKWR